MYYKYSEKQKFANVFIFNSINIPESRLLFLWWHYSSEGVPLNPRTLAIALGLSWDVAPSKCVHIYDSVNRCKYPKELIETNGYKLVRKIVTTNFVTKK